MHRKLGVGDVPEAYPKSREAESEGVLKSPPRKVDQCDTKKRSAVQLLMHRAALAFAARSIGTRSALRLFLPLYSRTARSRLPPPAQQHRKHVRQLSVTDRREDERLHKLAFSPLSPPWSYSHPRMDGRLYASPPAVSYPLHPVPQALHQTRYIGRQGKVYRPRWCRLRSAPR